MPERIDPVPVHRNFRQSQPSCRHDSDSIQEDTDMAYTKLIKLPEVMARTGKSRSAIYQGIKEGTFPKQIRLGGPRARAVAWVEAEIDTHNQSCIDASRSGDGP